VHGYLSYLDIVHYALSGQVYVIRSRKEDAIMMRALWTAASGMKAQQTSMDTVANNLSNINTTGYKKETAGFETLLYQTVQKETYDTDGNRKPIGEQIGLGTYVSSISTNFAQGEFEDTEGDYDFAVQGKGFFMIQMPDGSVQYTRNGHFNMAELSENEYQLSTSEGYAVLDMNQQPITFDTTKVDLTKVTFDRYGKVMYRDENGNPQYTGQQIGMAQFNNPGGMDKMGESYFKETAASGAARIEGIDQNLDRSIIKNGYLERSNVQAADEMVDMIITQRAYEMNSKAITASDEMLQQANNLRR
jgi:flagellar basal-body rod protein FlgG